MSADSHLVLIIDPRGDKDPIDFIIEEHRFSAGLAKQFNEAVNKEEKQNIAHVLIKRLCIHAACDPSGDPCDFLSSSVTDLKRILQGNALFSCEEIALFPIMRLKLPDGDAQVKRISLDRTICSPSALSRSMRLLQNTSKSRKNSINSTQWL